MPNSGTSNIVFAVDAEINVLVRRLEKLREIKRLAVELDAARLPAAAVAPKPQNTSHGRRWPPKLKVEDVTDAARDLLTEGPTTVNKILTAIGRWPSPSAAGVVEAALEELGAVVAGTAPGGAKTYALPADVDGDRRSKLLCAIEELSKTAIGWSDEEFQYQLLKRHELDASLAEVQQARRELKDAGA